MSDPYGHRVPGDNQGEHGDDAATPADGTYVDWAYAAPGDEPAHHASAAPRHAATPPAPPTTAAAYVTGAAGRRSARDLANEAVWRYRNAPLATRVTIDLIGLAVVLLLSAGGMFLLLRDGGGTDLAAAPAASDRGPTSDATSPPTTDPPTTLAPTTSTSTTTSTTTTSTTTTTVPPTTAPPTTVPPTTTPPTTTPPPTAPPPPRYDSCWEARAAGALPLFAGDPGYSGRLDRDEDGEACNSWRDWR